MIKMNEEEYIEYLEYLKKREEVYKDIFGLNYIENDYPKATSDEINKIIKPEWEYNKLQNNWNELKKWLEETIKQYDNVGLKFKKESNFECASRSYDYLKQYQTMLDKMQELEEAK